MSNIKKLYLSIFTVLILFAAAGVVSAKSVNSESAKAKPVSTPVQVQVTNTERNMNREATASGLQISNTIREMEQLETRVKSPKAKEALQLAAETAEQSQATVESSLNEMYGRPGFLKFIIGPDYKNAGQVRSEIVKLENEIRQLTRAKEGLSESDQAAIDESIAALEGDLTSIKTMLNEALKGISLFGWLSRFLSGFTAPVASPTPVASPSAVPSASPSVAPSATPSV